CPKHKLSRTCIKGKIWKFTVVIHSLRIKKCSKTCRRHVTHRTERVRCPQKKRVHWSRCHRCRSRKMVTKFRSIGCRCRRRLYKTDHFRSCCCHGGTRVKKLCQQSTGRWVRHISKKKLSGHKCVRHTKVKYLPRPVCRLPETPVTYGVCNRTTCQQTVTKVVNVLNKHTCSCHMVSKPAGTRTCCCLNTTPEIKINCVNNNMKQRVTVAPVFDEATHTCTTKTEIATELVTCGDGETRSSDPPCTGETRTIVRTRSVVVNCVCVNQTVDTRTEMCTCPSPTKWTVRCDVNSGKQVLTRTVYNLVNGSCSAVTETKLRTVFCNQKPQVVPVCNRDSCIETVTTTVTRLDMSTCTCVPDRTISTRQCCCPTTTQTRNECIDNQINTITTRQTLNAVTRTCESSDTTTRSGEVPCKNETRVNGPCDRATRKRKIKVTRREIINCQCQTTGVSVVRELCACPPTRKNQGQCDRKTCMRQVTLVKFNAVTSNNGTLHCVKTISHRQQRCCCTPLGHKRVRVHVQCDRETGNILINKEWSKFVASTKQCRTLHKSWIKEVDCTRKFDGEGHLEHRGRCNHRTGRRKIIMKWYTHDTRKCRCKLHVRKHYRICSCKHKRGMKHKYCDKETNELVSVRKFFVLEDDQCIPQESQKRKQIVCATNRQVKESCNNCDNVKVISYYVLSNCKCRKKEIVEKTKCCCPEEKFYRKCHLGKIKITTVKFRLSEDKRSCERIENHKYRRVRCSRKHKLKRGKCNHETCWAKDKLFKFYARKCHCHKQVHVKKRRCCCPKPKLRTRCRGRGILIHEKTVYHLHDGHCEPQLSRKRVRVHCPEPKHLGKSHCSRRTGRRSIQFKVFKLHKCRCVPKLQRRFEICACPRPRVVRQHCKDGRHHRAVFKIYFHRYEGSCKAKKRFIYKEPCHCPQPSHKTFCDSMDGHTLVKQTESFQMTMRHGRRECIHSHHEKPHRVHCHKRSVHRGGCYDGQRKISITEYKVRHCRCIKKQHVRYIRCRRRLHHRRQRRCHDGRIIKIASVYDPDSGEMREQRHVKRVLCRERPRVVPLSRGCKLREEDGGFYRKVAVIKSVLSGCHCKQKRRISWRLCRCHGSKTLHRCIHDFIEHQYTEKHHRHNGHCRRRRERRTREHRCSKRPVAIRKSRCDHHSCKRRVFLRRCYLKHCSCRCKQRVGYENCCTPPPVKKRYCKDGRWHYIKTRFRMHKDRLIGKDSDSGDEWRKMEVNPHTKRWSKRVDCPEPEIRQTCNRDTGVLTKRITVYRNIHCKCRPRMRTVHSRCQCPPPKTRAGHCVRGRRRLRHTNYRLGKNGHCHRHHTVSWKPCGCPKPRKKYRCHRGQIQICTTVFRKHRACRPKRQCRSKKVHCPPPKTKRGNCSQKTKKFKISHIRYTVNQKTCKCDRHVVARFAFCTCHHLKRKQKKCHGNVWVTVKINYRLNQGECVPDESVSHKAVKCRRQLTELVPGSCERRKGLSSSGTQIARTLTSVPVKCHCKNRVRTHRVPCICHLIKKYKTQKTTVCHSDRWLVTKVLQYRLVKGKCKPRKHKKSKTIRCHGRKIKQTACFKDDLGDSFQYELTLHKRPRHCRCHWKIVRKVRKNCGCRPPTSSRSCVSDNMWEQTVIKYTKPDVPSANCEPRTSISTRMVNCTTPRTKILSCNTHTCYAKEVTIRYKPKLCHCHPVRSYRSLRCCCPAPVVSPERCNATSNQFEQVTSRYTLINNTCVLQQNTTVRTVTCDTRSGETNTSVCNTTSNRQVVTIRDVSIVNCQCVTTTRSLTQPCSCPLNERVEKGLCNGTQNYTTDKYYRQQYNSTTRQCLEVLFNSVQRPCLCNAVSVRITCIGNTLRRVTHSEELVNNTCVKRAYITDREITCAGNGTSTQTRDGCNSVTRTRTITRINYVVENCTCVARSTRSSEICNCFELHGGRHDESTCRADNVTIRHISYYYDGPGGVCLQRNFTTEQRIKCKGKKEVPQGCNRDSRKEEIRIYHLVPIACKCEWSEQPPRYEDCKCKKSYSKKICHHDKQIIVTTYYKLVNGKCQKRKYKRVVPIDCDKKGRKTGIHYGRCSEFSGTRRVVKYVTRVHGCHCVTKRIRQRCPCRCPNSRTWSACKDNKVVTFRLTYQLRGCRCVKNLKNYESRTVCKKRRVARTACIKGLDGDGHLTVVHSREQSVNCRCQLEKHEHQEACLCQARESKNRECQGKKLSIVTTRRLLIQGTCQRVVVKLETQAVTCPLQSVRPVSACNKHGYRLLERTTWKAEDCHCKPHVRLEKQRCNRKCDKGPKVVRESKCDKETCTKRLYYYYKNQKCHSRHFAITAKCCCPPSHHGKQKCVGKAFEVRNLFYKLQHGVCVMSAVKYRQEIDCRRQEIFETATSASGDTIILKTWHAVKDCKCQKYKKKLLSKHRECRQPEVKHECVSVPEQRLVQTVTRFTKHSKHGECQKCEEVIEKPINCPLNIVHRGPCRKDSSRKAFVRVVRRISFRKVDCRCEPKKSTHHEVCRCFQPRFSTRCQGSKGRILITKHHFEVSPSGSKCYGRKETDSIQVNCDSTWRASHRGHFRDIKFHHRLEWHENGEQTEDNMLSRRRRDISETQIEGQDEGSDSGWDGSFSKFLEREVRVGCSCRVQRRKRHCHSRCPKSKKYLKCENGQTLCRVETTYQRNGRCRCSYRVRKNPVKVHLPKPKVVHHGCQKCQERIETIYYRNVNCKAKRFWRWHSRRCCCNKKPVVRVHCKAGQMLVSQRRTERLDKDGHCVPQYENKYKLISCKRIIREKPLTACADGHRVWRRELEKTVNCACKRGSEKIRRRCGFKACHPTVIKHGRCVNCASKVTKTEFIFNSATQKCEAKRFHHKKKCCCPSPRSTKKCIGNRLLLVTISYKYQISSGKCEKCKKSTDITHSIYKRCQRSKKTKIGSCMENGFRVIVTINPTLVDCECHKKQSLKFERCQCELPSVSESCVRNGTLKYRRVIKQELDGTVCKKIKEETYSEVECPVSTTSEGVCDSVSCQRIITDVSYSVENCTCQRLTTQRCPPTINETRTCERAENVLTITRQYQEFDLRNRACVIRTKTDRVGTICPQNYRSFASPCDQFRNNSFYRTVSESTTVASGCECVPQTTTRTELCGCDSARDYTVCTPENQILTYRIEYKPNENNTICEPNRVVLNVRDVQCDRTRRSNTPNCTTGTRSETTGETRITVVTTWQRAGRNCTCATQTRSEEILCACPENSEPKTVCDHKRHEKLNVTKVYRLLVTGSIRQCIPSKVVTRLGRIKCQAPVVQLGHCQFGLMTVKTIVHLIHGCHCVPKHFKHQQRCQKHLEPCINKLPDWLCADLDRKHDICTRNFTGAESDPELKQLAEASALCNRQCNRCDGCHSIGGHWQFKYADKECLVTDSRYPGLTIKGTAGFKNCLHKCKKNLSCRSFDFYLPSSQCTLARVDRDSLHDYLLPRKHLLGALPSDNRHRAATRCNLYERICSLRVTTRLQEVQLGCPKRQVSAGKSQCKCEPVSLALGHYRYCYRTATVKYFERSRSGVCVKRRAFLHVPCQHCRDHLSKHKCQAIDAQGGCSVSSTAQLCAKTCRLCLCDGREFVREGHCNQLTGTRVDTVLRTEWVPGFHMCRVVILHAKKRCPKCPVGIVIQPQPCIHGRRKIIHKKTTLIDGKCKESVKREVLKCHGCYAGVATSLGPCIHGHRTLTSVFAIQKKHGHCQERKTSYQVSCVGCPPSVVRTQPCINGRRLRQVSYYVHLPNTAECYKARFETEDRCGTLCHDQISHSECLYQQRTDQCSWNLYTRIVCPSTCNRC
uniref:VWFA domain-containing protein n=1 Tax=Macrostomum lignano TaxID=282301 RepID=A0A1I8GF89_9PLAT